jgi:hypothetical protein
MRNFGGVLLLLGVLGFFYASAQLENYDPVPMGTSIGDSLRYPAGKWEVARYGALAAGGFGLLMALFPKGR